MIVPEEATNRDWISIGQLPTEEVVRELVTEAHGRFAPVQEGDVARYIPALAEARPAHFVICAATSLVPGDSPDATWAFIQEGFSPFAVRPLAIDQRVTALAIATIRRNVGIATLLEEQERIWFDPDASTDLYTRQCAVRHGP
jgi:glutaminase